MKKVNKSRQALLQKKRTKRNQSRKGKTYNPSKYVLEQSPKETVSSSETVFVV